MRAVDRRTAVFILVGGVVATALVLGVMELSGDGSGEIPDAIRALPTVNAVINGTCALLLALGYLMIRNGRTKAHIVCMASAAVLSVAFLAGYFTYHAHAGSTKFPGTGWLRSLYFAVLISHSALAAIVFPMVVLLLFFALTGRFERHRGMARITLPIWLYVSLTGVVVYLMLYRL